MQARLRRAGATPVYVPQAWVWHYIPAERCSAEWIIDRAYRHGVSYAMDRGGGGGGLPAWVAARLVKGMIRRAVATMAFSPVLRLDARARQSYNRGLLAGFRLRREMAG